MRPKRKQIREGLERLELWIDRDTLMLAQMRMSFPGGDTKTIRLEDLAVNVSDCGRNVSHAALAGTASASACSRR